jgi:DNA polymerase III subunit epsilon
MKLSLTRPLVFFDLETTGVDAARDRIVQFAALKINPDNSERALATLVNPQRPIPPEATAVHHISDADVADAPIFPALANEIGSFFSGCDIAGFNSNRFDLPLLVEEFARCELPFPEPGCKFIDVQTIFHKKEERTLSAAYRFYCDRTLTDAHDAGADVRATYDVFRSQLERYNDIGTTVDDVHRFCNPEEIVDFARYLRRDTTGEVVFNFGKHKGKPVTQALDYVRWMLETDFPQATKIVLRRLIEGNGKS